MTTVQITSSDAVAKEATPAWNRPWPRPPRTSPITSSRRCPCG